MKRFLKFGVLALVLVLVAGCEAGGGKKLTCSSKESRNDESMEVKYIYTFNKDDELVSAEGVASRTYSDKDDAKDAKEDADDAADEINDIDGLSYKSKLSGKKVTVTMTAKLSKMDEDDIDAYFRSYFLVDADAERDDIKDKLEDYGYKCK